jgi:hypothetical protein
MQKIYKKKLKKHICAFSFNRFEIFGEFQQENSYISASDERILDRLKSMVDKFSSDFLSVRI